MRKALVILLLLIIAGCSHNGNSTSPVTPSITGPAGNSHPASSSQWLWGLWDVSWNPATGALDVIPLRNAEGIWNVTKFLQPPAGSLSNLGIQILDGSGLFTEGRIDIRVTIHHPFPNQKLRGFDVRGVVMGNGSMPDAYNLDLLYPGPDDLRLLNADGYTRWMNATEFRTPGLLGYTPGAAGSRNFTPSATLNAYKYFADDIEPDESVFNYFASSLAHVTNRGSLVPATSQSRDYQLRFPIDPLSVKFQYAVIAGWEKATSGGDLPAPSDFPDEANTFEPFALSIVDSSTLYFESPSKAGGDINIQLNLIDWWAYWDPDSLSDYLSKIVITSDTIGLPSQAVEFDFSTLDVNPTLAANGVAVNIEIPDVMPGGVENQEILIAFEMNGWDYSNPYGVPNDADTDPLTGYFIHSFNVAPDFNDPPVVVSGVDGATDVFITDVETYTVTVTDEDGPSLTYSWDVRDAFTGEIFFGPDPGDGDGSWILDWGQANTPGTVEIHCAISDGENEVNAIPLEVHVDDVIFHADLQDTVSGDNADWTRSEPVGISEWTTFVGEDNILQGHGFKFAPFNAIYLSDSAHILVTPEIDIPPSVDRAIVVVFHSYQFEYWDDVGFDGGNFKVTEAPTIPTYSDDEMEIIGGKDYDGWLFDTEIDNQMAFNSDQYTDELLVSAFDIPADLIGSGVHIGFAAATDFEDVGYFHGWLIDDVQVRALPPDGNAPPIAGSPVTGDTLVPMVTSYPGQYRVIGYDLEDDPLTFEWTVRDPLSGDIIYTIPSGMADDEVTIDWTLVGSPGEYEVHVSIYDGTHPGVSAEPLTVIVQNPIFHADFADTSTGDNYGWVAIDESGATSWTLTVGEDGLLSGFGYKWGEFDTSYSENSQGILLSPPIAVPLGISKVSVYVRHDFQFLASLDGGNFKVTMDPTLPTFSTDEENIDGGYDYDAELVGTPMDSQDAFGIGNADPNGMVSRMDLSSMMYGKDVRLGIASVSGTTFFNMRGWLIDDVVVAVTE